MNIGHGFQSILSNGFQLAGANWASAVLRGIYVWLITQFLGSADYGLWAYAVGASLLLMHLSGFGLEMLLPMRIGRNKRWLPEAVGTALFIRLWLLGIGAFGLIVYAILFESDDTLQFILPIMGAALIGRGVAMWCRIVFVSFERAAIYSAISIGMRCAEVLVGSTLLLAGAGLNWIAILHAASWILEALIGLRLVRERLTSWRLGLWKFEARPLLRQGAILGLAAFFVHWIRTGPIILWRHVEGDMVLLGQLGVAFVIAFIAVALAQPFFSAAIPVVSRAYSRQDARLDLYGGLTAVVALSLFGLGFLIMRVVGEPLMVLIFGAEFRVAGVLVAPCLLIGGLIVAPSGYLQLQVLKGRPWVDSVSSFLGGTALVGAFPIAVANWGVHGAVFAASGAWLVRLLSIVALAVALRRLGKDAVGGRSGNQ